MEKMIANILQAVAPGNQSRTGGGAGVDRGDSVSFYRHVQEKLQSSQQDNRNQLGTTAKVQKTRTNTATNKGKTPQMAEGDGLKKDLLKGKPTAADNDISDSREMTAEARLTKALSKVMAADDKTLDFQSLAALMAEVMRALQQLASGAEGKQGQWALGKQDAALIDTIALNAGMPSEQAANLLAQLQGEKQSFSLAELFGSMARHFEEVANRSAVLVSDSDLPLLQNLLGRMGVSQDKINEITTKALQGDDHFDLNLYLTALDSLKIPKGTESGTETAAFPGLPVPSVQTILNGAQAESSIAFAGTSSEVALETITLSAIDQEELQALLLRAGVSEEKVKALFSGDKGQQLNLAGMKEMLAAAVNDVKDGQVKADVPSFFRDLESLLSQTGFRDKAANWTPVVSDAAADVHKELSGLVDFSKVRIEKGQQTPPAAMPPPLTGEERSDSDAIAGTWPGQLGEEGDVFAGKGLMAEKQGTGDGLPGKEEDNQMTTSIDGLQAGGKTTATAVENRQTAATTATLRHSFETQTMDQITQGVFRGLKNNEHHLVLKLQPPEMGEVKIDLHIKNDHISMSFTMENAKVKETLESNMQQFRDNLAERGFVLGQVNVSVGQGNDGDERWQGLFMAAQDGERVISEAASQRLVQENYILPAAMVSADGVNLFV